MVSCLLHWMIPVTPSVHIYYSRYNEHNSSTLILTCYYIWYRVFVILHCILFFSFSYICVAMCRIYVVFEWMSSECAYVGMIVLAIRTLCALGYPVWIAALYKLKFIIIIITIIIVTSINNVYQIVCNKVLAFCCKKLVQSPCLIKLLCHILDD